jgi:signal transduction histidine kinase/GAF domain-containing protein
MDLKDAVDLYRDVLQRYTEGFSLEEVLGSVAEAIGGKRALLFVRRDMSSFLEPKLGWNMAEEETERIKDTILPLEWLTRQPARRYVILDKERLSELGIEHLGEKASDIIVLFPIRSHAHLRAALLITVERESELPEQQGYKVASISSILERMVELFSFEERQARPDRDGEPSRVELGILSNYLLGKTDYARAASLSLDLLIKLLNMDGGTVHRVRGPIGEQQATLIASRGWGGMPEIIDHLFENQLIGLLQSMKNSEERELSLDAGRISEYFPGVKPYFHANQVKSFLLTPIFHDDRLVGLLTLFGKAYAAMEARDMELLVQLAERLGALFFEEEEGQLKPSGPTWNFPALIDNLFQLDGRCTGVEDFLSAAVRLVAIDLSASMAFAFFGDELGPDRNFLWYASSIYGGETVFKETPGLTRMALNLQRMAVVKPENPLMKELPAFDEALSDRLVLLLIPARAQGLFLLLGFYLPAEKKLRRAEMSSLNPLASAILGIAQGLKGKKQSKGYRRSLEILTEIEGDLTASEDPRQLLRILARGGRELLDCDRAAIIILDESEGSFEGVAELADRPEAAQLDVFAGREMTQALEKGHALYGPEEENYGNIAAGDEGARSLIAIPLTGRRGKLGVLVFEKMGRRDYFGEFERNLAHFLAGQAVAVLESHREGTRLEAAAEENRQLLRISRRLSSSLNLGEMCSGLYEEFEGSIGAELLLLSIQGKTGDRRLVLFKGERNKAEAFNQLLEPQGALMAGLARSGKVIRNNLNTFLRDPGEDELASKGIRSYMAIMLQGADMKGVFLLGSTRGAAFMEREADLIEKTAGLIDSSITTPLRNEGLQGRIRLLEEMCRSQEERLQSKTDLINMASHEIRHPLTLIMGFSEVLRDYGDTLDEGESGEVADKLHKAAERLRRSVVNMMEVSRIESGKLSVQAEEIDIKPLLNSLTEELEARSLQQEVEVEVESDAEKIFADKDKLEIILFNLMDNAVKYSPPGSTVKVFARRSDNEIVLGVRDQGQGISEEYLNFIFEPFRKGQSEEYGNIKGMGLGLYIVNRLVEAHGGRIEVRSEHGRGSTFIARFPQKELTGKSISNPGLLRA